MTTMEQFNHYFDQALHHLPDSKLKEAMQYALHGGGKRLRVQLLLEAARAYQIPIEPVFPLACALEMIHTYSLVHDDLPAMDDDCLRRGRPTVHIKYDEATAILVGDALLSEAFYQISLYKGPHLQKILTHFASYIGANGMVLGQVYDLEGEGKSLNLNELKRIHYYKTGKLIALPLMLAGYAANHEEDLPHLEQIGMKLGLAFQIQDDILDVTSNSEVLGKTIGKDQLQEKSTYVRLLGLEHAKNQAELLLEEVLQEVDKLKVEPIYLTGIITQFVRREK